MAEHLVCSSHGRKMNGVAFRLGTVYTRFRDFFETLRVKSRRRCQAGFSRILKQLGSEGTPSNGAEVRFACLSSTNGKASM
jgi:hypothetical protein